MIGRYDRIDSVDIIYRDKIYPNIYLLTGYDIVSDFEVDLEGDLDFNEMQTSNRRTVCQLATIYDLFDFMDAKGIPYKSYCRTPDTLLVGGEKDCLIQPDLTFSWADEINACRKITSSRKFTKYPQSYVKATSDNSEYVLTAEGRRKVERYVKELAAKRKEILDADKDTIDETPDPVTVDDIVSDLNWGGVDENGEYLNGWYVTDHYDSDYPICLQLGVDFIEK